MRYYIKCIVNSEVMTLKTKAKNKKDAVKNIKKIYKPSKVISIATESVYIKPDDNITEDNFKRSNYPHYIKHTKGKDVAIYY